MIPTPRFTDSLARALLTPPAPTGPALSFYACGITPYAPAHIGHARSFVVFDLMAQTLRAGGHAVDVVRNITDVDDKIIAAARAAGRHWRAFAHDHAARIRRQMVQLGVDGYEEPAASDHIPDIIALIERLFERGHAYLAPTGEVLFDAASFQGSALMPHRPRDLRPLGAGRVDHAGKRAAADFVLWKPAKPEDPWWPSPWGDGRPGWHVECSAMIQRRFGTTVDYHGGGTDLRFPHHQAEIQQSEAAYGRPLAHRWVHHGAVRDAWGRKMSKSEGNYVELSEALDQADALLPGGGGAVVRLALLSTLWTRPLDWEPVLLQQVAARLRTWAQAAGGHSPAATSQPVAAALAANLNTPRAFSALDALATRALKGDAGAAGETAAGLIALGVPADMFRALAVNAADAPLPEAVRTLLEDRAKWRAQREWGRADALRDQLEALGYRLEDGPEGAVVRRAPKR